VSEVVRFLRTCDYRLVKELGSGACGKTVLLYDEQIEQHLVCKKYCPQDERHRESLYLNFVREIKLLYLLQHSNVVRVFSYYLYPEKYSGYILMEFVDGKDIEDFATEFPDKLNDIFIQAIDGFSYLEKSGILHRDIRPGNLLVGQGDQLKIIDLGFGKRVNTSVDFEKSITLNWWCKTPDEFLLGRYDFTTEIYFVGKLFERLIQTNNIGEFKHIELLQRMCEPDSEQRIKSFSEIERAVRSERFNEVDFTEEETGVYRRFAWALASLTSKIASGAKYISDIATIQSQLSVIYRSSMLEESITDSWRIIGCFVEGGFYYKSRASIETESLRDFLKLMKSSSSEQAKIIVANLHTRLDAVERYGKELEISDEDIPF